MGKIGKISRTTVEKDYIVGTYIVKNKYGVKLGVIEYNNRWNDYIWGQEKDIAMSIDCLLEVAGYLKAANLGTLKESKSIIKRRADKHGRK